MSFKIIISFIVLFLTVNLNAESDLLKDKIIRYNKLEKNQFIAKRIDSSKLFYDLSYWSKNKDKKYLIHILKKREYKTNFNFFFYVLFVLIILSLIRYSSNINLAIQFTQFTKLRAKSTYEYGFMKALLINSIFIMILSFVIFSLIILQFDLAILRSPSEILLFLISSISSCIFFKYFSNYFIIQTFGLKNKINKLKFLWIDFMYIFVSISLPLILLSTIMNSISQSIVLISILILYVILYIILIIKAFYINMNLLTNNVFKFIIYFYSVEIIPILLLLKYLKTFVV